MQASDEINSSFTASGRQPGELIGGTIFKEYIVTGITPEDFIKSHSAEIFSMSELMTKFSVICEDYRNQLVLDQPSMAINFCSKIIFKIGPDSRKIKKSYGDKVWKLRFRYRKENKMVIKTAFVSSFKKESRQFEQTVQEDNIILTIKEAGLLAMHTFTKLTELAYISDNIHYFSLL